MKERPIIFNGDMVRAILSGQKTQTRQAVANVRPDNCLTLRKPTKTKSGGHTHVLDAPQHCLCPFGKVGDRLWVREACRAKELESGLDVVCYPADQAETPIKAHPLDAGLWIDLYRYRGGKGKLVPSIHMPRWASRITLEITGVRVERLNDISQEDAQAEGMELTGWRPTYADPDSGGEVCTPYDNFAELWQSIYGAESWDANPWVWVIEFKRMEATA
ncbi:hypothetical protein [Symbiopectobacterium purcellii]|uniref:Morphogenetic protein n=1 Tax=Symbiopectobacterium purcellii TaxID=2871826 RepID=A0ABX9ATA1_9ENTR|nr:hypothetical protein [Symbiopectobacterium purcellii]QZN97814.1 hypothetical protein K6K13_11215 [Symbiopectobacterium purcellii]